MELYNKVCMYTVTLKYTYHIKNTLKKHIKMPG